MIDKDPDQNPPSVWKVIFGSFLDDQKDALWALKVGALLGSAGGVALGLYAFNIFGWPGVGFGLVVGAVIGGVGLWLMYQMA